MALDFFQAFNGVVTDLIVNLLVMFPAQQDEIGV